MAILSRIIYALVGLAGLWCITLLFRSSDEGRRATPATPPDGGYSLSKRRADQKAGSPYSILDHGAEPRSLSPPCSPFFQVFLVPGQKLAETISSCSIFS